MYNIYVHIHIYLCMLYYTHICIQIHMHAHANTYVFLNGNIWRMEFVESYKASPSNPTLAFYCTLRYVNIIKIRIMYNMYFLFHKGLDIYALTSETRVNFHIQGIWIWFCFGMRTAVLFLPSQGNPSSTLDQGKRLRT